jgi:hypothetical protein
MVLCLGAGVVAGLSGVGGGFLKTPAMSEVMHVPAKVAAATTTFTLGLTAATGLLVYAGQGRLELREGAAAVLGALAGGLLGARLQSSVSPVTARRLTGALLLVVAVAILSSFQAVGTLLVFGMLVAPASTAALMSRRVGVMMLVAAAVGSLSVYAGLLLSYHADLAAGASIVVVSVGVFLATLAVTEVRRSSTARHERDALPPHDHDHGGGHGHHH